jgi:hypothetical protein
MPDPELGSDITDAHLITDQQHANLRTQVQPRPQGISLDRADMSVAVRFGSRKNGQEGHQFLWVLTASAGPHQMHWQQAR